jgi:putative addiction module killer protein
MIEVLLYEQEDGQAPFNAWFDDLDHQAAAKVTIAVERLRLGNFSNVKGLGAGVQEFRINWGRGYRLYLGRDGEKLVILLTGGTKQRQDADIERAKTYWAEGMSMAVTRSFKAMIEDRLTRDPGFREALLRESVETMLAGDMDTGKAVLRDYIKATIGFTALGESIGTPSKSLIRMFGPKGNPNADNLFKVLGHLQKHAGIQLHLT